MSRTNLLDLLPDELESLAESLGAPRYRGRQLAGWIYGRGVSDLAAMTDLSRDFRQALAERGEVRVPELERATPSQDGSGKRALRLDGRRRRPAGLAPDARS